MKELLSRRRYEVLALLTFVLFAVVHLNTSSPILGLTQNGTFFHRFVQNFEARMSTVFFRLRGEHRAHPDVVVLEFDERAAEKLGLWPWKRDVIAGVLEKLVDADAKVIGLDMAFLDATGNDEIERQWLAQLSAEPNLPPSLQPLKVELEKRVSETPDDALEAFFKKAGPRVVQGVIPFRKEEAVAFKPETLARYREAAKGTVLTQIPGRVKGSVVELSNTNAYDYVGVQTPLPRFASAGSLFGHFGTLPDIDSTIRRSPMLVKLESPPGLFPSLALQVAARQLDATIVPIVDQGQLKAIELRGARTVTIPVEEEVPLTLVNYPGNFGQFQRISFAEVMEPGFDGARVKGKALLGGVTITGSSGDQRVTPFSEFTAGVYTHASLLSNVLAGDFLERNDRLNYLELALMLVLGLVIAVVVQQLASFPGKLVAIIAVLVGFTAITFTMFVSGYKMNWVVPTIHLTVTAFLSVFLGYLSLDREKVKMRSTFSRYLGEDVMDIALQDPDKLNRGEKREMTVLFSDIRGFTSLSEHMSPEKLADFINQYLSPMTQIVFDEKGTLDKYIGDAVMAFWNAPLNQPDHALRACRAAVHMLERLEELKAVWRKSGYPELEIGIGINTGQMVVGNMGSDVRVDYTVLGDAVNLGSRLEGTNKEYDTRIIISEFTRAAVADGIVTRRLGAVRVKGKKVPVGIYELRGLGTPSESDAKAIAAFEAGLAAWSSRRFDDAKTHFETVLAVWPNDSPSRDYLGEIDAFRDSPPPGDWDGVVSLKTK
ncbi:MAG: CHASE2 domain-containing protein [Archangium sp.]